MKAKVTLELTPDELVSLGDFLKTHGIGGGLPVRTLDGGEPVKPPKKPGDN